MDELQAYSVEGNQLGMHSLRAPLVQKKIVRLFNRFLTQTSATKQSIPLVHAACYIASDTVMYLFVMIQVMSQPQKGPVMGRVSGISLWSAELPELQGLSGKELGAARKQASQRWRLLDPEAKQLWIDLANARNQNITTS